jgi:hypothetical protein
MYFGFNVCNFIICRSRWARGLRCGSAAARLLGLWVRIPQGQRKFVCCECCVLSGRGLCVGLITRPEKSYRVWCVWVWSRIPENEEVLAHWGLLRHGKTILLYVYWPQTCFGYSCCHLQCGVTSTHYKNICVLAITTLKTATWIAETCRWSVYNNITSIEMPFPVAARSKA